MAIDKKEVILMLRYKLMLRRGSQEKIEYRFVSSSSGILATFDDRNIC